MKDFIYYALFLDKENRDLLIDTLYQNGYESMLNSAKTIFLDHCTLLHKYQINDNIKTFCECCKDTEFTITIDAIGFNDKAAAFRVRLEGIPCANTQPHITICTFNNGKPADSNSIMLWKFLEKEIKINALLDIDYKHREVNS